MELLHEYSLDNNIFNKVNTYYKYQKKNELCKDIVSISDSEKNNINNINNLDTNNQNRFFNPYGKDVILKICC